MSEISNNMVTTNKGKEMLLLSLSSQEESDKLIITNIRLGDGDLLEEDNIKDFTELKSFKKQISISEIKNNNDGTITLISYYDNSDVIEGFWLKEIGVYAKNGDQGEESLFSYANAGVLTTYIQPNTNKQPLSTLLVGVIVGQSTNFDVNIDLSNSITIEKFNEHNTSQEAHKNITEKIYEEMRQKADQGFTNFIRDGYKIEKTNNLDVTISSGSCFIDGEFIKNDEESTLSIGQNSLGLLYLDNTKEIKFKSLKFPEEYMDNNTVAFWRFDQSDSGHNIPNKAVGTSSIAVENDLIPTGGIEYIDGYIGKSLRLDGTTGKYVVSNVDNFPLSNSEWEIDFCFTVDKDAGTTQGLFAYTYATNNNLFSLRIDSHLLKFSVYTTDKSTNYYIHQGQTYFVTISYKNPNTYITINGHLIANYTDISYLSNAIESLKFGTYFNDAYFASITLHYFELRNKIRNFNQISKIANSLLFSMFYDKNESIKPNIPELYKSIYHEYLFDDEDSVDEESSTICTDSNSISNLNGTITDAKLVDSNIGFGKARYFDGTATNKIELGENSFNDNQEFTFITIVTANSYSNTYMFSSGDNNDANRFVFYTDTNGYPIVHFKSKAHSFVNYNTKIPLYVPTFIAITIKNNVINLYINNLKASPIYSAETLYVGYLNTYIGYSKVENKSFNGVIDYVMFGNFCFTETEILKYYNSLMKTGRNSILTDVLEKGQLSLGYIKTNSSKIVEYNDFDYKYGRREGATGGNRKVFLGWKYFNGSQSFIWENPFGSNKIRKTFMYTDNPISENEYLAINPSYVYNSGWWGILPYANNRDSNLSNDNDQITASYGVRALTVVNGVEMTSGFVGCYAEVMEDFEEEY